MATVSLKNVKKKFGSTEVIQGISTDIKDGEFIVIVGPSGCGKSTLLRMIAGLETVTEGEIFIDEDFVNEKLGTGILIQPGNKSQLKDAIFMILKNEEKFSKNISNVTINFTYEAFGEKLVEIYESIKKK